MDKKFKGVNVEQTTASDFYPNRKIAVIVVLAMAEESVRSGYSLEETDNRSWTATKGEPFTTAYTERQVWITDMSEYAE